MWCIPPQATGEFVWRMEDVLDVYTQPYDPRVPQVCLDETSTQLLREVRPPLPVAPGQPARIDPEYAREGVLNLFLCCEPLAGRRWVTVSERRTKLDWAHQIKELCDVRYPDAERIVLVQDNLNTQTLTPRRRSTTPFRRPRRSASWPSWSCTSHPSMGVGSTSPRSSSVS
jgi:hypothetical protein